MYSFVNRWLKRAGNIKVYIIIIQRSVLRLFIYFPELCTIRLNDVAVFEWNNYNIEWFLIRENDFFQIKHFSFKLLIHSLKQVVKVNWKKNLVKINVHWRHWHYFIVYISYWKVYQVNYKEESFAWKYIEKFPGTNKLMWKFARRFLTTKRPSLKVYCWCLHKFHYLKNVVV